MSQIHRVVSTRISSFLLSAGWANPFQCVQAARHGQCLSITCEAILSELDEKLRLRRGMTAERAAEVIEEIRAFSTLVEITGKLNAVAADPDDDAIIECAIVSQAQFLVSGDHHLLDLGKHAEIQILKAADFLKLLPKKPSA